MPTSALVYECAGVWLRVTDTHGLGGFVGRLSGWRPFWVELYTAHAAALVRWVMRDSLDDASVPMFGMRRVSVRGVSGQQPPQCSVRRPSRSEYLLGGVQRCAAFARSTPGQHLPSLCRSSGDISACCSQGCLPLIQALSGAGRVAGVFFRGSFCFVATGLRL